MSDNRSLPDRNAPTKSIGIVTPKTPQEWLEWGEDLIATHSRLQVAETLADMGEQVQIIAQLHAEIERLRAAGDKATRACQDEAERLREAGIRVGMYRFGLDRKTAAEMLDREREALEGCVCSETGARNCPVHQNEESR